MMFRIIILDKENDKFILLPQSFVSYEATECRIDKIFKSKFKSIVFQTDKWYLKLWAWAKGYDTI